MGLFNFFNQKDRTDKKTAPHLRQKSFQLKASDFESASHESEVRSIKTSDDFKELFADYIVGSPMKSGDTLKLGHYIAKVNLWGQPIEIIYFSKLNQENLGSANDKLNWIAENKRWLDLKIIDGLLELKNNNWLEENELPLSEDVFLNSICISSISFQVNAPITLTYNDGGLFDGHSINLDLDARNEIINVSI